MIGKRNIIKRESILGLPVIDVKTGEKLGVVKDVYKKIIVLTYKGFM